MKLHFSKPEFDFFQYEGRVKANETTYQQRNDFYFFETLARKLTKQETMEYLLASFVDAQDPTKVWIGDIKRSGKNKFLGFKKLHESLTYTFEQDLNRVAHSMEEEGITFDNILRSLGQTPLLLTLYVKELIHLETLIIFDIVLGFTKEWDNNMIDPLWESISFKIKKYKPFLSLNKNKYSSIMKAKFLWVFYKQSLSPKRSDK